MEKGKGFTLIELLIVMVLIGLITGIAMLSMGTADPSNQQKQEAERLVKLLELASEEAVNRGEIFGLELFGQSYRFTVMQNQKWHSESTDLVFRPRLLMPQMMLTISVNQQLIALEREPLPAIEPHPQVILTPDGDMDLFQIKMILPNSVIFYEINNTPKDGLIISTQDRL